MIENSASVRKAVLFRATNRQSSNSLAAGHGAIPSAARRHSGGAARCCRVVSFTKRAYSLASYRDYCKTLVSLSQAY